MKRPLPMTPPALIPLKPYPGHRFWRRQLIPVFSDPDPRADKKEDASSSNFSANEFKSNLERGCIRPSRQRPLSAARW